MDRKSTWISRIPALLWLLLAAILYMTQRFIYMRFWARALEVDIHFEGKEIFEGERGRLVETITNAKRLPLPMIKCKFLTSRSLMFDNSTVNQNTDNYYRNDVFTLGGRERLTRTISFKAAKRGLYNINSFELVGTDMFFTLQTVLMQKMYDEIYVLPRPFNTSEIKNSLQWINGEIKSKAHLIEDPFEYVGVREYQPFDELKNINWKATAKTGDLKVNTHGYTARQGVRIFLNLKDDGVLKHRENVENSIRFAVRMCMEFIGSGDRVALFANIPDVITGKPLIIPAGTGESHMEAILRGLARLDTDKRHFDFAETFRDEVFEEKSDYMTVFVSTPSANDFDGFVREYHETGKDFRHFILCQVGDKYEANVENAVFTTVICMEKK